jgi:hypothetical protein
MASSNSFTTLLLFTMVMSTSASGSDQACNATAIRLQSYSTSIFSRKIAVHSLLLINIHKTSAVRGHKFIFTNTCPNSSKLWLYFSIGLMHRMDALLLRGSRVRIQYWKPSNPTAILKIKLLFSSGWEHICKSECSINDETFHHYAILKRSNQKPRYSVMYPP